MLCRSCHNAPWPIKGFRIKHGDDMMRRTSIVLLLVLFGLVGCNGSAKNGHDQAEVQSATPVDGDWVVVQNPVEADGLNPITSVRSEEHTSELQSRRDL